ncbi:MAG TPA: UvrD-helicase domain-containing protein, partial [Verrucomicrobiae bacterium]|nr:UvrD-helicase domain-containing protein [Verrucomicrobiae bacterium]
MQIRFLLGPAGSGKTYRCVSEIRQTLLTSPDGPELLWVAPRQATYQLERQLLSDAALAGYTRLQVLSFERLARHILENYRDTIPQYLDEEGRLMVLRSLLARKRDDLKLFRASARLTGFAQQLSIALRELQQNQLTPEALAKLATQVQRVEGLSFKLQDLAVLLQEYQGWLQAHALQDADSLLAAAALALRPPAEQPAQRFSPPAFDGLWVDGFADYSEPELELLAALLPYCERATLTFCLDHVPATKTSWLSNWSAIRRTFERCRTRLSSLPTVEVRTEVLPRDPVKTRFAGNPVLQHLENHWAQPRPFSEAGANQMAAALRVAICSDPEAEVALAAREILQYVRAGGRYRDVTILARNLADYHHAFQRVFSRYEIPLFLDRRESVSHHPLAELTRSALRTVAYDWRQEDWFAALKTGLVPANEIDIDRLENEALARGWEGAAWQNPLEIHDDPELTRWLAGLLRRVLPAFQRLALDLAVARNKPNGCQLAAALRQFWAKLRIEETLENWAAMEMPLGAFRTFSSVHATVWVQLNTWLDNVELAFPDHPLSLREWLPILEAGLSTLSVGVIPPALDQVLVGTIDRSRNPDCRITIMLGWNESVFPSSPESTLLLTETDRSELEKFNPALGSAVNQHLQRERYYAYIACTRPRQKLVLTAAHFDA